MTELVWNGKYDKDGKRVGPVRIGLPFQTVETVNESAEDRKRTLSLFAEGRQTEWRNRLIWGDKKYVLPSLLPEFAGKVNLIYIDPPFDTGADFSFNATIPDCPETAEDETTQFLKQPSIIEQKAYRDTWGRGLDSYLQWLYETVVLLRELLADDGSIYVHLDWHVGPYAEVVLDEVLGMGARGAKLEPGFRNDISWCYTGSYAPGQRIYSHKHDVILFYTRSQMWTFKPYEAKMQFADSTKARAQHTDGSFGHERSGPLPDYKYPEDWWADIPALKAGYERVGFDTQKPERLLDRILKVSSREHDLVLDCFVGSGTTAAVAEKLGRRWIACDLSRFAIHVTRKRLLSVPDLKPFVIQNLGKYERQQWQGAEFAAEDAGARELAYRRFILELYHADPIGGHTWLYGVKSGRMIHVGAVDAPVTIGDVKAIVAEFWQAAGGSGGPTRNGVDILGWEFAFEINETAKHLAAEANVDIAFKKIPREVLDKRAVEQGDVYFFELGALSADVKTTGREVSVSVTDFLIPPDDVPEDVRPSIKHFSQMIDYWAVDWDFKDDTFHNQWQTYRTRKDPKIALATKHKYDAPGKHTIVIKVVDILGNDTTSAVHVEVK